MERKVFPESPQSRSKRKAMPTSSPDQPPAKYMPPLIRVIQPKTRGPLKSLMGMASNSQTSSSSTSVPTTESMTSTPTQSEVTVRQGQSVQEHQDDPDIQEVQHIQTISNVRTPSNAVRTQPMQQHVQMVSQNHSQLNLQNHQQVQVVSTNTGPIQYIQALPNQQMQIFTTPGGVAAPGNVTYMMVSAPPPMQRQPPPTDVTYMSDGEESNNSVVYLNTVPERQPEMPVFSVSGHVRINKALVDAVPFHHHRKPHIAEMCNEGVKNGTLKIVAFRGRSLGGLTRFASAIQDVESKKSIAHACVFCHRVYTKRGGTLSGHLMRCKLKHLGPDRLPQKGSHNAVDDNSQTGQRMTGYSSRRGTSLGYLVTSGIASGAMRLTPCRSRHNDGRFMYASTIHAVASGDVVGYTCNLCHYVYKNKSGSFHQHVENCEAKHESDLAALGKREQEIQTDNLPENFLPRPISFISDREANYEKFHNHRYPSLAKHLREGVASGQFKVAVIRGCSEKGLSKFACQVMDVETDEVFGYVCTFCNQVYKNRGGTLSLHLDKCQKDYVENGGRLDDADDDGLRRPMRHQGFHSNRQPELADLCNKGMADGTLRITQGRGRTINGHFNGVIYVENNETNAAVAFACGFCNQVYRTRGGTLTQHMERCRRIELNSGELNYTFERTVRTEITKSFIDAIVKDKVAVNAYHKEGLTNLLQSFVNIAYQAGLEEAREKKPRLPPEVKQMRASALTLRRHMIAKGLIEQSVSEHHMQTMVPNEEVIDDNMEMETIHIDIDGDETQHIELEQIDQEEGDEELDDEEEEEEEEVGEEQIIGDDEDYVGM